MVFTQLLAPVHGQGGMMCRDADLFCHSFWGRGGLQEMCERITKSGEIRWLAGPLSLHQGGHRDKFCSNTPPNFPRHFAPGIAFEPNKEFPRKHSCRQLTVTNLGRVVVCVCVDGGVRFGNR